MLLICVKSVLSTLTKTFNRKFLPLDSTYKKTFPIGAKLVAPVFLMGMVVFVALKTFDILLELFLQ